MQIIFNSSFNEITRLTNDKWVKGNNGNVLEILIDGIDIANSIYTFEYVIEWSNGITTNSLPMAKSLDQTYVYATLPTLEESGLAKITLRVYRDTTLWQTAIFTRLINDNVEANDDVHITQPEYESFKTYLNSLNQDVIELKELIDSGIGGGTGGSGTLNHSNLYNLSYENSGHTGFQKQLVSGTNIKTINGHSILGNGNIAIQGGSSGDSYTRTEADTIFATKTELSNVEQNSASKQYVQEQLSGASTNKAVNDTDDLFDLNGDPYPAGSVDVSAVTKLINVDGITIFANDLKVGDNVFIRAQNIPDLWVSSVVNNGSTPYAVLSHLETQKVDIQTDLYYTKSQSDLRYAKNDDINSIEGDVADLKARVDVLESNGVQIDALINVTDEVNNNNGEIDQYTQGILYRVYTPSTNKYNVYFKVNEVVEGSSTMVELPLETPTTNKNYFDFKFVGVGFTSSNSTITITYYLDNILTTTTSSTSRGIYELYGYAPLKLTSGYTTVYMEGHVLTKEEADELYALKGEAGGSVDAYTKAESDNKYVSKTEADSKYATIETTTQGLQALNERVGDFEDGKQDRLVSGYNIKTINGQSILGQGDITIVGGSEEPSIDLSNYLTNDAANEIFVQKNDAENTYAKKDIVSQNQETINEIQENFANYYDKTVTDATFLKKEDANSLYLTETEANNSFATKQELNGINSDLTNNYYTANSADNKFVQKTIYNTKVEELQNSINSNKSDIDSAKLNINDLINRKAEKTEIPDVSSFITETQGNQLYVSNDSFNTYTEDIETTLTNIDGRIDGLGNNVDELSTRLTTAENNISGNTTSINALETRLEALENRVANVYKTINSTSYGSN